MNSKQVSKQPSRSNFNNPKKLKSPKPQKPKSTIATRLQRLERIICLTTDVFCLRYSKYETTASFNLFNLSNENINSVKVGRNNIPRSYVDLFIDTDSEYTVTISCLDSYYMPIVWAPNDVDNININGVKIDFSVTHRFSNHLNMKGSIYTRKDIIGIDIIFEKKLKIY